MSGQKELSPMDDRKLDSSTGVAMKDMCALKDMKRLEDEMRLKGRLKRIVLKSGAIVDTTRPDEFPEALKRFRNSWA